MTIKSIISKEDNIFILSLSLKIGLLEPFNTYLSEVRDTTKISALDIFLHP